MSSTLRYGLLVLVVALQAIFWNLDAKPIYKTQEIRVAETAREMVTGGDWIIPHYNGDVRLRKPPLAYWLTASSYLAFGEVSEFTARFASATFALLGVVALFLWLRRTLGLDTALAAVLCFTTSYLSLRYFRSGETDAILLFFVTTGCIVVYQLLHAGVTLPRVLLLHLLMGLGFLTKGPAAIAIPLAVLLFFSIRERRYDALKKLAHPAGLAILLIVAFGWYATIYFKLTDIATYWVGEEIEATYLGGRRPNPGWWYVPGTFSFYFPWSLFIIPAGVWLYRNRPLSPAIQFALAWFVLTFLMLSANISKQPQYALLLNPPLAVLLGHYLTVAQGRYALVNRVLIVVLFVCAAIAAVVAFRKWHVEVGVEFVPVLLLGALLPLALALLLRVDVRRHVAALLLAGVLASAWSYGQEKVYVEGQEAEVKRFALAVKDYQPLYMYENGNVRVSFYTARVVPTLKNPQRLAERVAAEGVIYVITTGRQDLPTGAAVPAPTRLAQDGPYVLWRVQRGGGDIGMAGGSR